MIALSLEQAALAVIAVSIFLFGVLVARAHSHWRLSRTKGAAAAPLPDVPMEEQLRNLVEKGGNERVVMEGGFHLRELFASAKGFTVRGGLTLADDSTLDSPVEVFGNATIGARARVARPLFVHGDLILGNDARVPSCHVEGNVFFHPGSAVEGTLKCNAAYIVDGALDGGGGAETLSAVDVAKATSSSA